MDNKLYVLLEFTEKNTGVVGIFRTKEHALSYLRNYQLTQGEIVEDWESVPEYMIYDFLLGPNLDRPEKVYVYGQAWWCTYDTGVTELALNPCHYEARLEKLHLGNRDFNRDFFKEQNDDYYFGFLLDVSSLDKDIPIKDYRKYIKNKVCEFIMRHIKENKHGRK